MAEYKILGLITDKVNNHNVIYPKDIVRKAIDEYMLKGKDERIGLYGYPEDSTTVDISKAAFIIESLDIVDNQVIADIITLNNPFGIKLDELANDNIDLLRLGFFSFVDFEDIGESPTLRKINKLVIRCPFIIKYEDWAWVENKI